VRLIVLWDVDGTIVSISKILTNRHLRAVSTYTQKTVSLIDTEPGQTDIGIIKEIFDSNKLDYKYKDLKECLKLLNLISLREIDAASNVVNPGIPAALKYVSEAGGINSLLTGNSKVRARHKLTVLGLESFFDFDLGYFGDDYLTRSELVLSAKSSVCNSLFEDMILIGDARNDIIAAKACNSKIIAVATGKHPYLELHELRPDLLVRNFLVGDKSFRNFISELLQE
jgi:phosphoglycolate phosphatase